MAGTAHSDDEDVKEHFDDEDVLEKKIKELARLIKRSKHLVAFTGAGISTSAGIPDFRGPEGKWTRQAKGLGSKKGVSPIRALPTKTHMSLVQLARVGKLKWLISQNCDGLHVRSGFPQNRISELHGNSNIEICEVCGQRYFRDFKCRRVEKKVKGKRRWQRRDHFTGRFCVRQNCDGRLLNSTIDFGQTLPDAPLANAKKHSKEADLHIALGSSLRVTPAADCPEWTAKKGGDLVIVNLQTTPLDIDAIDHIFAKTDEVMERVMKLLGFEIPPFRLLRKVIVGCDPSTGVIYCRGADVDDPTLEMDFVRAIKWSKPILGSRTDAEFFDHQEGQILETDVPTNHLQSEIKSINDVDQALFDSSEEMRIFMKGEIKFAGHYDEPNLVLGCDFTEAFRSRRRVEYLWSLEYDPYEKVWATNCELSSVGKPDYEFDDEIGTSHAEYVISRIEKHAKKSYPEATKIWMKHVKDSTEKCKRELDLEKKICKQMIKKFRC